VKYIHVQPVFEPLQNHSQLLVNQYSFNTNPLHVPMMAYSDGRLAVKPHINAQSGRLSQYRLNAIVDRTVYMQHVQTLDRRAIIISSMAYTFFISELTVQFSTIYFQQTPFYTVLSAITVVGSFVSQ